MARKEIDYTVQDAGRDQGKVFHIVEMPATKAARWGRRAMLALAKGGQDIPDNVLDMGIAGIAVYGLKSLGTMTDEQAEELIAELMTCVRCMPDANQPAVTRGLVESDIEEWMTHFKLQAAVFELHTGFFGRAAQLRSALARLLQPGQTENSPGTRTSSASPAP